MVDAQGLEPLLIRLRDGEVTLEYVAAEIAAGVWPHRASITDPKVMGWWVDARDSPDRSKECGNILSMAYSATKIITLEQYSVLVDALRRSNPPVLPAEGIPRET